MTPPPLTSAQTQTTDGTSGPVREASMLTTRCQPLFKNKQTSQKLNNRMDRWYFLVVNSCKQAGLKRTLANLLNTDVSYSG